MNKCTSIIINIVALTIFLFFSCSKDSPVETVSENINPICYINHPSDGSSFPSDRIIEIYVIANDEDGEIARVNFYINDHLIYEDTEYPYQYFWDTSGESNGEKLIYTESIDNEGSITSDSVVVNIGWVYEQPEQIDDGWETARLDSVRIDSKLLCDLMYILNNTQDHLIHGILIARHGKLVFEQYFDGLTHPTWGEEFVTFGRERPHVLSSVAKSFTATLLGIAINRGFISSVDTKVFDFYPELAEMNIGRKQDITVRHLANMSSGLGWDEATLPLTDPNNDLTRFINTALTTNEDLAAFILGMTMKWEPGTFFDYGGGNYNLLGNIIQRACEMRLDEFAKEYLFEPLGIDYSWWWLLRPDFVYASGDIALLPRDMVKFGQLFLQNGNWNGEQIISEEWAIQSATSKFTFTWSDWPLQYYHFNGYSFGWWTRDENYGQGAYLASGWGGQEIIVLPEHDMVVVFTGGSYWDDPLLKPYVMMERYVLPAIFSN